MLHIRILAVGKTDRGFVQEGVQHFLRRIKPFAALDMVEIRSAGHSGRDAASALEREAGNILKNIKAKDMVVLLDEHGQQRSSRELSMWFGDLSSHGINSVTFVIGGAYGVGQDVRSRADSTLSLSRLTFPHQLVRVMFLEQIYRALSLSAGHGYHHD